MEPDVVKWEIVLLTHLSFKRIQMYEKYPKGQSRGRHWKHLKQILQAENFQNYPFDDLNCNSSKNYHFPLLGIEISNFSWFNQKQEKDGAEVQLKSVTLQQYVCVENGGGMEVTVNRDVASSWETFKFGYLTTYSCSLEIRKTNLFLLPFFIPMHDFFDVSALGRKNICSL